MEVVLPHVTTKEENFATYKDNPPPQYILNFAFVLWDRLVSIHRPERQMYMHCFEAGQDAACFLSGDA